jgi:hypothetical protein
MFDWLKKLLTHKPTVTVEHVSGMPVFPGIFAELPPSESSLHKNNETEKLQRSDESEEKERDDAIAQRLKELDEETERIKPSKIAVHDVVKNMRIRSIADRNRQRQQDTLGFGLRGKFKPRSHYEKSLWKLNKKAGDKDN